MTYWVNLESCRDFPDWYLDALIELYTPGEYGVPCCEFDSEIGDMLRVERARRHIQRTIARDPLRYYWGM